MRCIAWVVVAAACSHPPRTERVVSPPPSPPPSPPVDAAPAVVDPLAAPMPVELPSLAAGIPVVAKEFVVVPYEADATHGTLGTAPIAGGRAIEQPTQEGPWPRYELALDATGTADAVLLADRFGTWRRATGELSRAWQKRAAIGVATPEGVKRARFLLRPLRDEVDLEIPRVIVDSTAVLLVGEDDAVTEIPWVDVPTKLAVRSPIVVRIAEDARIEQVVGLFATLEKLGIRDAVIEDNYERFDEAYDHAKFEIDVDLEIKQARRRIQRPIEERRHQLKRCYLAEARRSPGISAHVVFSLDVPAAGRLAGVTLVKGTGPMAACFQRVVASIDFPPLKQGAATVTTGIKVRQGLRRFP